MNNSDGDWSDGKGWGCVPEEEYGQIFYKRATGELPEMESSKAVAKILATLINDGDRILDVGCGAGHYLRSLKRIIPHSFSYTGVDKTSLYIDLARKAFKGQENVSFEVNGLPDLKMLDKNFEFVLSNNVFLHLSSIEKPFKELCRLAKKYVLIRTLVGDKSFRIQEIRNLGDEFDEDGTPKKFNYYNIYSRAYIEHLISKVPAIKKWEIVADHDFNPDRISASVAEQPKLHNATTMLGDWQINKYILQPWVFIKLVLF